MIDRKCQACGKQFQTEHNYAHNCPPCHFAAKAKEKKEQSTKPELTDNPTLAAALNRVANSIRALAKAVEKSA